MRPVGSEDCPSMSYLFPPEGAAVKNKLARQSSSGPMVNLYTGRALP